MSGGSLDYLYQRLDDLAEAVDRNATKALHRAFAQHLRKCAKAAKDLEWMLSGDTSPGDEDKSILAVVSRQELVETAIQLIRTAIKDAREVEKRLAPKKPRRKR